MVKAKFDRSVQGYKNAVWAILGAKIAMQFQSESGRVKRLIVYSTFNLNAWGK